MRALLFCALAAFIMPPVFSLADVEAPVRFEALDLADLGNFHGEKAQNPAVGWGFWGAREPIVTPDWVVFPFPGKYRFIIEAQSQQFVPEDTKNGIYAEVDLRGRFLDLNNVKKIAKNIQDQQQGELLILHTRVKADMAKGEWFTEILEAGSVDPPGKTVIQDDQKTGIIEFEAGMKAQLAVWFTNDQWQPDPPPAKDRNLRLRALEILAPENINLAVDPKSKLATTWGHLKVSR
jgi:hypothetical protein